MALVVNVQVLITRDAIAANSTFSSAFNVQIVQCISLKFHDSFIIFLPDRPCEREKKGHFECDISTRVSFNSIRKLILVHIWFTRHGMNDDDAQAQSS